MIKALHNSNGIQGNVQSFIVLFVSGKIAAPFYYIIVLWQLTLITPIIERCIYRCSYVRWCLHFITPIALGFNYYWEFSGLHSEFYFTVSTFFIWFEFYYLGMLVSTKEKYTLLFFHKIQKIHVIVLLSLSIIESIFLYIQWNDASFAVSQNTIGTYFYTFGLISLFLRFSQNWFHKEKLWNLFVKIGNCSYGIFYVHMIAIYCFEKIASEFNLAENWYLYSCFVFFLTAISSFGLVLVVQKILRKVNGESALKYIGF